MNKIIPTAAAVFLTIGHGLSQGYIVFDTHGAALSGFIRFSNTVTGTWASEGIVAGLYWGSDQASVTNLVPHLAPVAGPWTGALPSLWGFIIGGTRFVGRPGTPTYFQVKAWSDEFSSWEAAFTTGDPNVLASVSAQSPIVVGFPSATFEPARGIPWGGTLENPLIVELIPVPEAPVWALGALGAGLLFRRLRRDAMQRQWRKSKTR